MVGVGEQCSSSGFIFKTIISGTKEGWSEHKNGHLCVHEYFAQNNKVNLVQAVIGLLLRNGHATKQVGVCTYIIIVAIQMSEKVEPVHIIFHSVGGIG